MREYPYLQYLCSIYNIYSQMGDGGGVGKSSFRNNRDIVSVER